MPVEKLPQYDIIDNYLWISNLGENGLYFILPTWPNSIQDQMQNSYNPTNSLSRSAPMYSYQYSGPRTISFNLELHREMLDLVNITNDTIIKYKNTLKEDSYDTVDTLLKAVSSLSAPKYTLSTRAVEPPTVAVKIGTEVYIKGIVNNSINIEYRKPLIKYEDGKTRYAVCSINFVVTEVDPYDSATLYRTGSFRNITSTSYIAASTVASEEQRTESVTPKIDFQSLKKNENRQNGNVNKQVAISTNKTNTPSSISIWNPSTGKTTKQGILLPELISMYGNCFSDYSYGGIGTQESKTGILQCTTFVACIICGLTGKHLFKTTADQELLNKWQIENYDSWMFVGSGTAYPDAKNWPGARLNTGKEWVARGFEYNKTFDYFINNQNNSTATLMIGDILVTDGNSSYGHVSIIQDFHSIPDGSGMYNETKYEIVKAEGNYANSGARISYMDKDDFNKIRYIIRAPRIIRTEAMENSIKQPKDLAIFASALL